MSNPMPQHEAISASAGSGKTFQLAHRFIRLLAMGVPPDRINAMTFSRKAAGEIFDSIVKYLYQSAEDGRAAARTAGHVKQPHLTQADFAALLRGFVEALHRLRIGTLDSFMVSVARAFPAELGIPFGFQVMDSEGTPAQDMREQVLAQIFDPKQRDSRKQRAFLEAFKQANFGREEKNFGRRLDAFITDYRGDYQLLPRREGWGDPSTIWPQGSPWLVAVEDIEATAAALLDSLQAAGLPDKALERWRTFVAAVRAFRAGAPFNKDIEYLFVKLIEQIDSLRTGAATLKTDRQEYALSRQQCLWALDLVGFVMHQELQMATRQTQGVFGVLHEYEEVYDQAVRRTGCLTFTDAQYLLTPANSHAGGALLSRIPDSDGRIFIDYRLDCQLDHWLLDEFQDTSDLQWRVLRNLVDEIVQDGSGKRSFFYVGDVKQAIYTWRGGNARLFRSILDTYGEQITQTPLSRSFRSAQPIIDTVNQVFGDIAASNLPPATAANWRTVWQHHSCQVGVVPPEGYVAIVEPQRDDAPKPTAEDCHRLAAHIVNGINPLARGLSTAVLVRTNRAAVEVVQTLRQMCPDMPVVHEGSSSILDCQVVALLLALLKYAMHPGDSMALRHLQMSPLGAALAAPRTPGQGAENDRELAPGLLRQAHELGLRGFLAHWSEVLQTAAPLDDFARLRLGDLLDLATAFDTDGTRDIDAFIRTAITHQVRESATSAAIKVMTIHQAKGLGFDVVILPDLAGDSMDKNSKLGLELLRDTHDNTPLWALQMPRRLIAENDDVLRRLLNKSDENAAFDALCLLYVAMTRAKRALYLVTSFPGKSAKALTPAAFVKKQLLGDPPYSGLTERNCRETFQVDAGSAQPRPPGHSLQALPLLLEGEPVVSHVFRQSQRVASGSESVASGVSPDRWPVRPTLQPATDGIAGASQSATLLWQTGSRDWYTRIAMPKRPAPPARLALPAGFAVRAPVRTRLLPVEPSGQEIVKQKASKLFSPDLSDVLTFGSAIHALFEQIEWFPDTQPETIVTHWKTTVALQPLVLNDVVQQFRTALRAPEIQAALSKPSAPSELWREKPFEIVLDGRKWVSGIFDRVVLIKDDNDRYCSATIYDFKSDQITTPVQIANSVKRYRPQLELYRQALAAITGLAGKHIMLQLLFTRPGRAVPL